MKEWNAWYTNVCKEYYLEKNFRINFKTALWRVPIAMEVAFGWCYSARFYLWDVYLEILYSEFSTWEKTFVKMILVRQFFCYSVVWRNCTHCWCCHALCRSVRSGSTGIFNGPKAVRFLPALVGRTRALTPEQRELLHVIMIYILLWCNKSLQTITKNQLFIVGIKATWILYMCIRIVIKFELCHDG